MISCIEVSVLVYVFEVGRSWHLFLSIKHSLNKLLDIMATTLPQDILLLGEILFGQSLGLISEESEVYGNILAIKIIPNHFDGGKTCLCRVSSTVF